MKKELKTAGRERRKNAWARAVLKMYCGFATCNQFSYRYETEIKNTQLRGATSDLFLLSCYDRLFIYFFINRAPCKRSGQTINNGPVRTITNE